MKCKCSEEARSIAKQLPSAEDCSRIAAAFAQLGDCTRLRVLWLLCHSERCVADIAEAVGMSSPAVAHHLKLLRSAGLIVGRREGREMRYRLGDTAECREIHRAIDALFHVNCPGFVHDDEHK